MTGTADKALRLLHDRVLADRARHGDRAAFQELRRRHAAATWRLALVITRSTASASVAVRSAFASVLTQPDRTAGAAALPVRALLLGATREAAITGQPGVAATDTMLELDTDVPVAFHQLPELWRSVLWLTDVEELPQPEVAQVLDLTDDGLERLLGRARSGVHEQLTHEQTSGLTADCHRTTAQLAAYAADDLAPRQALRVRKHLDACGECRARLEEVDDLHPGLRRSMVALPLVLLADLESAWAAGLVTAAGPLHLTLPGGRPVPAWAERALAGAAVVAITVGITGALLTGRGKGREDLVRETATEQPFGIDDGESALGGSGDDSADPRTDDGGGAGLSPTPPAGGDSEGASAGGSAGTGPSQRAAGPGTGEVPRGSGPAPTPSPAPTSPTSPPPTAGPAPSSPPTTQGPALEVSVVIPDTVGVTVGDQCTDVSLLGTQLSGCGTTEPGIQVGGSLLPPVTLGL